jgi:hypothetical protein
MARPPIAAVAAVLPLAMLTACGPATATHSPQSPAASPQSPGTPTAPASTAPPGGAAAPLAAYTGMWHAMEVAGTTADWRYPGLARYSAGTALATLQSGLRTISREGVVIRGTLTISPSVTTLTGGQARITDCLNDTHWLNYIRATGKLQNNVPGGHRVVQAIVTRDHDGHWLVTALAVHGEGTC